MRSPLEWVLRRGCLAECPLWYSHCAGGMIPLQPRCDLGDRRGILEEGIHEDASNPLAQALSTVLLLSKLLCVTNLPIR